MRQNRKIAARPPLRRHLGLCLLMVIMLSGFARQTLAQAVVADLSDHLIAVTTGFDGAKLLLFGAVEGDGADVIVVIRGPSEEIVVRRKERIGGIWINNHKLVFGGVPAFYWLASTRPLEAIASDRILARHGIGLEQIRMINPVGENGDLSTFREALIRNKKRLGLYPEANGNVTLLGGRLFRSDIFFPSNVPTGSYDVTVYLLRNGKVISAQTTPLTVSKIGLGAQAFNFAHNHSILYGIGAIAMALFAGWFAGAVAKKS
jgi:uncharacterized protein (TIGR02186 family)